MFTLFPFNFRYIVHWNRLSAIRFTRKRKFLLTYMHLRVKADAHYDNKSRLPIAYRYHLFSFKFCFCFHLICAFAIGIKMLASKFSSAATTPMHSSHCYKAMQDRSVSWKRQIHLNKFVHFARNLIILLQLFRLFFRYYFSLLLLLLETVGCIIRWWHFG